MTCAPFYSEHINSFSQFDIPMADEDFAIYSLSQFWRVYLQLTLVVHMLESYLLLVVLLLVELHLLGRDWLAPTPHVLAHPLLRTRLL